MLLAKVRQTLEERGSLANSLVILGGGASPLYDSGLRYVYDVPIVGSRAPTEAVVSTIMPQELALHHTLYLLDYQDSRLAQPHSDLLTAIESAGYRCTGLWTYSVIWYDPNDVSLFEWPKTSAIMTLTFTLYSID